MMVVDHAYLVNDEGDTGGPQVVEGKLAKTSRRRKGRLLLWRPASAIRRESNQKGHKQ